jgi:elongation factor Ts
VSVSHGVVASYVHNAAAPGLGTIGVLVALESAGHADALNDIGHKIAMHIAARAPLWVSREDIPADVVADKRAELADQAQKTGKPPAVVEKMVEGRLRKFYEEVVLGLQPFVLNPDQRVESALREAETAAAASIAVTAFVRFRTGEGLDKIVASAG